MHTHTYQKQMHKRYPHKQDIDECAESLHDCDLNAKCLNTPGSFECGCNIGWGGPGTTCSDISMQILVSPEARDSMAGFSLQLQPIVQVCMICVRVCEHRCAHVW